MGEIRQNSKLQRNVEMNLDYFNAALVPPAEVLADAVPVVPPVAAVVVAVVSVVPLGCAPRTGGFIPEGPETTRTGWIAVGALDGAGLLSAGCISTTHPVAATKVPMSRVDLSE